MSLRGDVVVGWPTALKSGVEFRVWDFGFGVYCLRYIGLLFNCHQNVFVFDCSRNNTTCSTYFIELVTNTCELA